MLFGLGQCLFNSGKYVMNERKYVNPIFVADINSYALCTIKIKLSDDEV